MAQANRLFVNLTEQGAALRSRPRSDPAPEPDREPGREVVEGPAVVPQVAGEVRRPDLDEVLEIVRVALSAINGRLDALERILLVDGTPAASSEGPVAQPGGAQEPPDGSAFALDGALRWTEDVELASGSLPVLGLIPEVDNWSNRTISLVGEETKEKRAVGEAYRALRTSVLFLGVDRQLRSLQVTSPLQGEGKSATAANLAVTLAEAGKRVIALSCDLRRPRLHEFFGLSNAQGFTSVLQKQVPLQSVVQQVPSIPSLKLVASGPVPTNPSELLLSDRAAAVISVLHDQCDVLLIDCPPVLPVTDAVAISKRVQGTIVVVNAGSTSRRDLHRTVEILRQVDAPLLGTVVNGISEDQLGYGLGRGLRYEYTSDPSSERRVDGRERPSDGGSTPGEAGPAAHSTGGGRDSGEVRSSAPPVRNPERRRRIWGSRNTS